MPDGTPVGADEPTARPTLEIVQRVDARDLICSMPMVRAAQAIRAVAPGAVIEVFATDRGSGRKFEVWAKATGNRLLETSPEADGYRFVLQRK
jgi:tRNA 2-thiouridine synthesizing protein A